MSHNKHSRVAECVQARPPIVVDENTQSRFWQRCHDAADIEKS